MERSREKLKDLLKGSAWGPDLVDTIFAISDRVGRSTKAAASGAAEATTTVISQVAASVAWNRVADKPDTFPPSTHTHDQYLTEETDPTVPEHVKAITEEQIEAWDSMSVGEQTIPILAADDISVDSLVGITSGGAVRADAVAGIEAVGIARNSASSGQTVNLVRGGLIGALTVPFPRGTLLYLGTSGNLASAPPSTGLAQRVGIATPTAAIIEIHQPIHQE